MEKIDSLRQHGLFDARVPRYTSYPPANHFEQGIGPRYQSEWLKTVPNGSEVSVYIHIPFCKRLCWFCACRTQGTKTMRPVDAYVEVLRQEIARARQSLPRGIRMGRLHLGGGTPTILRPETMRLLLETVFDAFQTAEGFEFSVEIDPTEASDALLETLVGFGMNRASIGVQDFEPTVQEAIGRLQSLEQTQRVIHFLRRHDVKSLNLDLLYGLPHQTPETFAKTLAHVTKMKPDRLAIYGYAHVPWMSKRQVMIKTEDLPGAEARFRLAEMAHDVFTQQGYNAIGIDHFALPSDSLSDAAARGRLRRNFQGYTDDQSETLVGFGASAISRFHQGYVQNATATSAYQERINAGGFAGHKGYRMEEQDLLIARAVEDLMCRFVFREKDLCAAYPEFAPNIHKTAIRLMTRFPDVFFISDAGLEMRPDAHPLVRVIASFIDQFTSEDVAHSAAI
ncbi:oxygen-independent coproporphyrinogen III oxidase [Sulfitobacter sp. JB4-11]|uniref:oxygen-independent coproporphyrinogen III oxidase n=1 Tax=Sulfitobacter rhodophyticola TaxID=3238304 RepID=UPI00351199D0